MKIGLASPDQIRAWSYGVVERPETINYRSIPAYLYDLPRFATKVRKDIWSYKGLGVFLR